MEKNIIEECESSYTASIVLVPKPNSAMRVCVGYCKLNAISTTDIYSFPRIDDLIHDTIKAAFVSTLDLPYG